jgi:hypothetical protein
MQAPMLDKQIARREFVDNAIYELLVTAGPPKILIGWDNCQIKVIRDAIQTVLCANYGVMTAQEFYPNPQTTIK